MGKLYKKPTLQETLDFAKKMWDLGKKKDGTNTLLFNSLEDYLKYTTDLYNELIKPMTKQQFHDYNEMYSNELVKGIGTLNVSHEQLKKENKDKGESNG